MDTLILHIKNKNKKPALLNFLKSIDYIKVEERQALADKDFIQKLPPNAKKLRKKLIDAFKEIKLAEEGKVKLKTGRELIEEMKTW